MFIDQMFRLFDRDGNGKISFRVLIIDCDDDDTGYYGGVDYAVYPKNLT